MRVFLPVVKLLVVALVLLAVPAAPASAAAFDPASELPQMPETCAAQDVAPPRAAPRAMTAAAPGVRRVVRGYARRGAISAEERDRYLNAYEDAIGVRNRLGGSRRAQLAAVIAQLEAFARTKILRASRLPVLFTQLEVNAEWWAENGIPAPPPPPPRREDRPCAGGTGQGGARVVREGVVYQWYSGQGLQVQQLGTAGRANGILRNCLEKPELACNRRRARRVADALAGLAVDRGGFKAWEYYFAFGGGRPPWISGLAQGTMMQALSRATRLLGDPRYLELAREARPAFERRAPVGVRAPAEAGSHYLIYSFNPGLRVLNGFLQSLVGLYDYAEAADDDRARRLFAEGERQARREVPRADTGAWSRYSAGGSESDLGYHRLVRDFLQSLCDRTERGVYCATAERFTRYLHESTRMRLLDTPRPRARRLATTRVSLSKISCVTLRVRRGGRTVATSSRVLGRGGHSLTWVPRRRGRYAVEVEARDLMNHLTTIRTTVTVR